MKKNESYNTVVSLLQCITTCNVNVTYLLRSLGSTSTSSSSRRCFGQYRGFSCSSSGCLCRKGRSFTTTASSTAAVCTTLYGTSHVAEGMTVVIGSRCR
jgi:hypothetical protein